MELTAKTLSDLLVTNFLNLWMAVLVALSIYTLFYYFKASHHRSFFQALTQKLNHSFYSLLRNPYKQLGSTFFIVFIVGYVFVITYKQTFAIIDNDIFTESILKGFNYYPPIWPEAGRFFPLGHQEWHLWGSLINHRDLTGYFSLSIIQLFLIAIGLLKILRFLPFLYRLGIVVVMLSLPSFFTSFLTLTIPERNLILCLVVFILAFQAYEISKDKFYGGVTLISTHFILYYKEPSFVLLAIFCIVRLAIFIHRDQQPVRYLRNFLLLKKSRIEAVILLFCLGFLFSYTIIMLPYRSLSYGSDRSHSPLFTFSSYLQSNPLLVIFLLVIVTRLILVSFKQISPHLFWDALGLGMVGYFLCYVKLGLVSDYYLAPVDLIAAIYLSHFLWTTLKNKRWKRVILLSVGIAILWTSINQTMNIYLTRFNSMNGQAEITEFLKKYSSSQSSNSDFTQLYFPYSLPYQIYYLSCFLKYQNLSLATNNFSKQPNTVDYKLTSPQTFSENNNCVDWNQDHHCFTVDSPQENDLIIILPDSKIESQELNKWQQEDNLLFHYQPFPQSSKMHGYVFLKS